MKTALAQDEGHRVASVGAQAANSAAFCTCPNRNRESSSVPSAGHIRPFSPIVHEMKATPLPVFHSRSILCFH